MGACQLGCCNILTLRPLVLHAAQLLEENLIHSIVLLSQRMQEALRVLEAACALHGSEAAYTQLQDYIGLVVCLIKPKGYMTSWCTWPTTNVIVCVFIHRALLSNICLCCNDSHECQSCINFVCLLVPASVMNIGIQTLNKRRTQSLMMSDIINADQSSMADSSSGLSVWGTTE